MANIPLNSMGLYTAYDRVPLSRIGDSPISLHTDLKFHNQAIEVRQSCGERNSFICLRDYTLLMRPSCVLAQDICELVASSLE